MDSRLRRNDGTSRDIDSLPTTISSQGVYCLRKNLSTAITSGRAISIDTNNVTIDCNDFKIGGLAAGNSSKAQGIVSSARQNITVRNCNLRGFYIGIQLFDGAGHLLEHNRLDNNLYVGIYAGYASNSVVRHNRVFDTGGLPDSGTRAGIHSYAGDGNEISDNIISGVFGTPGFDNGAVGIERTNYVPDSSHSSTHIIGNTISGLAPSGTGTAYGFYNSNAGGTSGMVIFANNNLFATPGVADATGIACRYSHVSIRGNIVKRFPTTWDAPCMDAGGNVAH